ncbi:hypothetical protein [Serratia fonticola]|jgi:hypothetical protein|uniref:hypothetical protein n=1 Tax=Serratia fonticola TaxID=47917 RepID=UPI00211C445D|nr:hypothetical protein [Serratia fonticola]MDQ7212535.1 hypothetical protein [Serratia fonticola]
MKLLELIQNPESRRLSTSDSALFVALLISSFCLVWVTVTGQVEEWMYGFYLAAWVAQSQGSKQAALQRYKAKKSGESKEPDTTDGAEKSNG